MPENQCHELACNGLMYNAFRSSTENSAREDRSSRMIARLKRSKSACS